MIGGDLILIDDKGGIRDLVRFNSSNSTAVFHSLSRADTDLLLGFPNALYANVVRVIEDEVEGTIYTPKRDQPGFVSGCAGQVTYFFYRRIVWPMQQHMRADVVAPQGGVAGPMLPPQGIPGGSGPLGLPELPPRTIGGVPDAGSTFLLFSWGIVGLVWVRRRLAYRAGRSHLGNDSADPNIHVRPLAQRLVR